MRYTTQRRVRRLVPVMVAGAVLCTVPLGGDASSAGEPTFKLLHAFESPPTDPRAELIEASDGALYGTTFQGGSYNQGIVFKVNKDGSGFISLLDFNGANGGRPKAGLVEASDGALYGTTEMGGRYGYGVVFKIEKDGTGFADVHDFGLDRDGNYPIASLIEGADGALYGTAFRGGAHDSGTVFKVNKDGSGFLKLHDFNRSDPGNGTDLWYGLLQGSDGALYGNAAGGSYGSGVVYRLGTDGAGFLKLHDFNWADPADGSGPSGKLVEGSDGALYGTTVVGGASFNGTVFRLNKDGTGFLKLHDFDVQNGAYPEAGVIEGSDGALYGTTASGGAYKWGVAFKVERDGSGFLKLHDVARGYGGYHELAGLVEGSDGMLYGTGNDGGSYHWGIAFKLGKDGTGFQSLHDFSPAVGTFLYSKLLQGSDGALYGTTYQGGAHGSGTIFKLTSASVGFPFHTFQTLHDFDVSDPANGAYPRAGLIEGSDGELYGTASDGGARGGGVVFRIRRDGSGFSKLHDLGGSDGSQPSAPLMEGSDGALYGTTSVTSRVFKVNKDGTGFQKLLSLGDWADPAGLVEASDGMLYGTTRRGGANDDGIVFRLGKDGTGYLKLHDFNFADGANGSQPYGELIQASDGALYGTARSGGTSPPYGIVFKIDKNGFHKVHDFGGPDGWAPMAGVIEGPDGVLYGTTYSGGLRYYGTVFKVNKDGTGFLTLHSFSRSDGLGPSAELVQGSRGAWYGTTYGGGPGGGGVVFSLVIPPANGNANGVPGTATIPPRP